MPSTYTLNNGIELIATGEQSGTWGDTTNTNLALIDTALDGQVTVTLAAAGSSGSPNTLPISDGSASNGRNRLVIFDDGGDLGATAYVQLTPNDAEKIVYIRNDLSGSRSIILFQGTYNASNDYEVPAGTTAVVFFNGGGAGAVAANVFNNAFFDSLRLGSVSVTAILDEDNMASDSDTALATQQSIKAYVDAQVGANNELSEVLANGNTTGGTDIVVSSGDQITTNTINETTAASGVTIDGVLLKDNGITATGGGSLTGTWSDLGTVTTVDINGGTIDGTTIGGTTPAAVTGTTITGTSFVSSGDMTFGDNDKAIFGAGSDLQIYHDGSNSWVSDQGTGQLILESGGAGVYIQKGATETMANFIADGAVSLYYDNAKKIETTATGVDVTGDIGADTATISGNLTVDTNTLFVDAANNRVGIGTSSPSYSLDVEDSSSGFIKASFVSTGTTHSSITFDNTGSSSDSVRVGSNNNDFYVRTSGTERMRIDSSGNVGIGTSSPAGKLDVVGAIRLTNTANAANFGTLSDGGGLVITSGNSNPMYFNTGGAERMRIDSSGNVGIGVTSNRNSTKLDVLGDVTFGANASYYGTLAYNAGAGFLDMTSGDGGFRWFAQSGPTERMRIDSSGNVGIGTSSISHKLHVNGQTGTETLYVMTSGGTGTGFLGGLSDWTAGATDNNFAVATYQANMCFFTDNNPAEKMRIDSSGNVGIGTSSPSKKLHVSTTGTYDGILLSNGHAQSAARLQLNNDDSKSLQIDVGGSTQSTYGPYIANNAAIVANSAPLNIGTDSANHVAFYTALNERMRIDSAGNVGIGTSSPTTILDVRETSTGGSTEIRVYNTDNSNTTTQTAALFLSPDSRSNGALIFAEKENADFSTSAARDVALVFSPVNNNTQTEYMRIDSIGNVLVGTTDASPGGNNVEGVRLGSRSEFSSDGGVTIYVNRLQDGTLVSFRSAGNGEGAISVSGTTVTYGGGHLARWSRLPNDVVADIPKGTVMTNLDDMITWTKLDGTVEDNEQLNYTEISSVEGDVNIAGVFDHWDNDDDDQGYDSDFFLAETGDFIIRIAQGTTVQRGDLLMSAGDGTAKPQGDDIIRSKTIAKVTSTHVTCTYEDGSYCVPCVLMAC
jgi:hypothetical protein